MSVNDQRQSIIGLPLQERSIAVALKHVFQQIKQIEQDQKKEVSALNHSFTAKFKTIENKASQIIRGTTITNQYLSKANHFFPQTDNKEIEAIAKANKGIKNYWATALTNFYGGDFTQADQQIAAALKDISTNITEDVIQVTFDLGANEWISAGILTKSFPLKQGVVAGVNGDCADWLKQRPDGIFSIILCQNQLCDLNDAFTIASELVSEIVPYSLQHYLDANEQPDQDLLGQSQQDEGQDESVPVKKIKQ